MNSLSWEVIASLPSKKKISPTEIVSTILKNRGVDDINSFLNPKDPLKITLSEVGIDSVEIKKAIARIEEAIEKNEKIIVYGDYDVDGVTSTAIMWECLYSRGANVLPYIPERFEEGYGLNIESIAALKKAYPDLKLIITVDNGIVAHSGVKFANENGIDVVITDHHEKEKNTPEALAIVHTTEVSGAGVSWFTAREIANKLPLKKANFSSEETLSLTALGIIADQLPLLSVNRSLVRHGLIELNKTKRPGLIALFKDANLQIGKLGVYEVGFMIAPRINAVGRLKHAIDALRLLCTRDLGKSLLLAKLLSNTNLERQKIVEEVVLHAKESEISQRGVILLAHESYHEGVIGLAAAKLVEEFYRPAIVFSKGAEVTKASARSIIGFNMIEAVRIVGEDWATGGGHQMAAGFSLPTSRLSEFFEKFQTYAIGKLTEELLRRKLKIDLEITFGEISWDLIENLSQLSPFGAGNPTPVFMTRNVDLSDVRVIGSTASHLKFRFVNNDREYSGVGFNMANKFAFLKKGCKIHLAYSLEKNIWNGIENIEMKVKDIKEEGDNEFANNQ